MGKSCGPRASTPRAAPREPPARTASACAGRGEGAWAGGRVAREGGLAGGRGEHGPDWGAVENVFQARKVRRALKLGRARGVALLAAPRAGLAVAEYPPAEIKRAVVGF